MRRIGEPWLPGKPYRDRPGVYAIITGSLRSGAPGLLCVEQDGEMQLPGGGVDPGEHPIAALHREVLEETGWTISAPRRIVGFQRFVYMPEYQYWARKAQAIYVSRAIHRLGPPQEAGHTPHWLPVEVALHALDVEGDRWALASAINSGRVRA
ncbi:MAG: NUDIX domain-containing protein [Pseudomonadota bacterium]